MSCLFDSLAPSVSLDSGVLRRAIAAYLKTDPVLLDNIKAADVVQWTEGENLQDYANKMARNSTWGGAIEIRAFCELFHMNVVIHVSYTGRKFTIETSKRRRATVHIKYNGWHFEPYFVEF